MERAQTIAQRYPVPIDDGRGFLPDQIAFKAPVGMRAEIQAAAAAAGTTSAAYIRATLVEKLQVVLPTVATEG